MMMIDRDVSIFFGIIESHFFAPTSHGRVAANCQSLLILVVGILFFVRNIY